MEPQPDYGICRTLAQPFEEVDRRVRAALEAEGFGVLTEIDVRATLRKKLDVDVPKYSILGACNPRLAHAAILAEPDVGLLLPCNVVVRQLDEARTVVEAVDPVVQMRLTGNPSLEPIAAEIRERLERAVEKAATG